MRIRFHRAATAEAEAAVRWYNERVAGLGEDFRCELADPIDRITRAPLVRWRIPGGLQVIGSGACDRSTDVSDERRVPHTRRSVAWPRVSLLRARRPVSCSPNAFGCRSAATRLGRRLCGPRMAQERKTRRAHCELTPRFYSDARGGFEPPTFGL